MAGEMQLALGKVGLERLADEEDETADLSLLPGWCCMHLILPQVTERKSDGRRRPIGSFRIWRGGCPPHQPSDARRDQPDLDVVSKALAVVIVLYRRLLFLV